MKEAAIRLKEVEASLADETARSERRHAWLEGTDQLVHSLAAIEPSVNTLPATKNAVELLLNQCVLILHQQYDVRAAVLMSEEEKLKPWVTFGIEPKTLADLNLRTKKRTDDDQIGTAGLAHVNQRSYRGYVIKGTNGKWDVQAEGYIPHLGRRDAPPYMCFICLPLVITALGGSDKGKALSIGVLILDSMTPELFDLPEIDAFTKSLRRKLNSALQIGIALRWPNQVAVEGGGTNLGGTKIARS